MEKQRACWSPKLADNPFFRHPSPLIARRSMGNVLTDGRSQKGLSEAVSPFLSWQRMRGPLLE
jgi:hypothetical protein